MSKKIIVFVIISILLGFIIGIILYKKDNAQIIAIKNNENIVNEVVNNMQIATSIVEVKITPNTTIIKQTYYKICGHQINEVEKVTTDLINMNKQEFEEIYKDWNIKEFNNNTVVVYKEINEYCQEHYLMQDNEGHINIYMLDEIGNKNKLLEETSIPTAYLPDEDKKNLKKGITIFTKEELNKLIEDFNS